MEVTPATFAQVKTGRDGRRVTVTEDVGDVARRLQEISPKLILVWNENGQYFVVVERDGNGDERLVFTAQECDERIVKRAELITSSSYDFVGEMDRLDKAAERAKDHEFHERTGEIAERLAHAVRKDLNPGRMIVPKGV